MVNKLIRFTHHEYNLIVKAEVEWPDDAPEPIIKQIDFGLPRKASKLEKLLLKYVEIYCYDVLRNNMYDSVRNSESYQKFYNAEGMRRLRAGLGLIK